MSEATLLSITGIDLGDYSVRDLTMTIEPIPQGAAFARTINGTLLDLSLPQFRNKYRVSISCTDHESPILVDDVPLGTEVNVVCIPHLGTRGETTDGQEQLVLDMMVVGWNASRREWAAATSWQLALEEI